MGERPSGDEGWTLLEGRRMYVYAHASCIYLVVACGSKGQVDKMADQPQIKANICRQSLSEPLAGHPATRNKHWNGLQNSHLGTVRISAIFRLDQT